MQSVSMRVPGLESRMSSGAVNTLPVTSSVCVESPGEGQNWDTADTEEIRAETSTGTEMLSRCHGTLSLSSSHCPGHAQGLANPSSGMKQEVSFIKCLITSSFLSVVKMRWSSAFC